LPAKNAGQSVNPVTHCLDFIFADKESLFFKVELKRGFIFSLLSDAYCWLDTL
jgi:hypothetical protein